MTEKDKKNDESLSKFFTPDRTEQIKNDIMSVDALFEKFPAPNPSGRTLADIKEKIARQLEKQKRTNWTVVLIKTAVAAAIAIALCAAVLMNFNRSRPNQYAENQQQNALWQNEEALTFDAEINQLNSDLLAINYGEESGTNGILSEQVEQLELEIAETENTFWKG